MVRSASELNDAGITSGDPFWCPKSMYARRCQQESILLLAPVTVSAQRGPRANTLRDCADAAAPWRNLRGGRGGRSSSNGGRLFKIVKFMSPDAGISKKIYLAQKCLKNIFFQVPVARGGNPGEKTFPKDLGNKKVCHNPWPLF